MGEAVMRHPDRPASPILCRCGAAAKLRYTATGKRAARMAGVGR